MNPLFENILTPQTVDALEKYAPYYQGIAQNQLASVEQATVFTAQHLQPMARDKGVSMDDPLILANAATSGPSVAPFKLASEIIADGFPSSKRMNLVYVFGKQDPEADHPSDSINVALAIQMYFGSPTTAPNKEGLWTEISKQMPAAPVNIPAPPPPELVQPVVVPKSTPVVDPFAPPPIFGNDPETGLPLDKDGKVVKPAAESKKGSKADK